MPMRSTRRLLLLAVIVFGAGLVPAAADAARVDPLGFRLSSSTYRVHESAGAAVITVRRLNTTSKAWIRYIALPGTAVRSQDFTPVKSILAFQPGQSSATFRIPIVDHHMPGPERTIKIGLFGAYPIGLAVPHGAVLTIINDDPVGVRHVAENPLALPQRPPPSNPLQGATAYVDPQASLAAAQADRWRYSHPVWARMLDVISAQPAVQRYGNWSGPTVGLQVSQYLEHAAIRSPGRVPELSTYWLVWHHCGQAADPPWRVAEYHRWIESLAHGISDYRAILFLEMDSLITVNCLSQHGRAVRLHELHDAINILSKVPRLVVYLDAGAADALSAVRTARLLREAGVAKIQGFFLNSTHFDWTLNEIRYGEMVSQLTGGKHFVINTAENGRGPLRPRNRVRYGNEVLCDPPGRGLGPKPTFHTGFPKVDAFAWIANPGRSGGQCRPGAPPTGYFWPKLALDLVHNADYWVR